MDLDPEIYKELIKTFSAEFDELAEQMTECLLKLESVTDKEQKSDILNTLFRAAHTIKGSARSVEINPVSDVGHHLEDLFSEVREGRMSVSSELIDACFMAIDTMKEAMTLFVSDKADQINVSGAIEKITAFLKGDRDLGKDAALQENNAPATPDSAQSDQKSEENAEDEDQEPVGSTSDNNDFIKVSISKINHITALSDELLSVKLEVDDYVNELYTLKLNVQKMHQNCKKMCAIKHETLVANGDDDEFSEMFMRADADMSALAGLVHALHYNMRSAASELGFVSTSLQDNARMLGLVSAGVILTPMLRNARDIARSLDKKIALKLSGEDIKVDRSVLNLARDPLLHLLRNAIDHGIETCAQRKELGKSDEGQISI
jgi:two-component system chemotaxis sensor kinase CheA